MIGFDLAKPANGKSVATVNAIRIHRSLFDLLLNSIPFSRLRG
jgi:hypothetical protein